MGGVGVKSKLGYFYLYYVYGLSDFYVRAIVPLASTHLNPS